MSAAQNPPTVFEAGYTGALNAFKAWKTAEKTQQTKARSLLAQIYAFGQLCAAHKDEFETFCEANKIKVRADAAANHYIRVVKAVIGGLVKADGKEEAVWRADDAQTNKYANILYFAEKTGVQPAEFLEWLESPDEGKGGGTITIANDRAIASNLLPHRQGGGKSAERLQAGEKALKEAWNASVVEKIEGEERVIRLDRSLVGLAANVTRVQLIADVASDGKLTILGVMPKSRDQLDREVRSAAPKSDGSAKSSGSHPLKTLFDIIKLAKLFNGTAPGVVIENGDHGLSVCLASLTSLNSPVAIMTSTQKDAGLPEGKWVLTAEAIQAITYAKRTLKDCMWRIVKRKGVPTIEVTSTEGLTVQQVEEVIQAGRVKKWQTMAALAEKKGRKKPKEPSAIVRPTALKSDKAAFYICFDSPSKLKGANVPKLKEWAKAGDATFEINASQRKIICEKADQYVKDQKPYLFASIQETGFDLRLPTDAAGTACLEFKNKLEIDRPVNFTVRPGDIKTLFTQLGSVSNGTHTARATSHGMLVVANGGSKTWELYLPGWAGSAFDNSALVPVSLS